MAENQYGFPTEVLSLPSKGLLYPEDSPLRSGTIDVKYMTAKEEDILTSQNLITQGVVIERLLQSVIATPGVKLDDLLIGDKNALMMGTRILGYGKDYPVVITDPETGVEVETTIDLTTIKEKKVDESLLQNGNNFEFELPNSKRKIGFKLLTHKDETEIDKILKSLEKAEKLTGISTEITTRLKYQIQSIDGDKEQKTIDNFVDNEFLSLDVRAYRKYVTSLTPDMDLTFDYTSGNGNTTQVAVPLGLDFFWPAAE
jgi:hypothetical protein